MKSLFLFLVLSVTLFSCKRDETIDISRLVGETKVPFTFNVQEHQVSDNFATKAHSAFGPLDSKVENLWVLQFNGTSPESTLAIPPTYESVTDGLTQALLKKAVGQTIYFVANTCNEGLYSSEVYEEGVYTLTDFESSDFAVQPAIERNLIPMVGVVTGDILSDGSIGGASTTGMTTVGQVNSVNLYRLFARVTVNYSVSTASDPDLRTHLKVKRVTLRNAPTRTKIARTLFTNNETLSDYKSPTSDLITDYTKDIPDSPDSPAAPAAGTVFFYLPENLGGIDSENTTPSSKIGTDRPQSSYVEIECAYSPPDVTPNTITYSTFLGSDNTSNYNVISNVPYTYTITLSGVTQGDRVSFTKPVVFTSPTESADIGVTQATLGGIIKVLGGGGSITEHGIMYRTVTSDGDFIKLPPIPLGEGTENGSKPGEFSALLPASPLTAFTANTKYEYKAYAANSTVNVEGAVLKFATDPVVTTLGPQDVTLTSAILRGTVNTGGDADILEHGLLMALTSINEVLVVDPNSDRHKLIRTEAPVLPVTTAPDGEIFIFSHSGLQPGNAYKVRAYAIKKPIYEGSNFDVAYGDEVVFFTTPPPTLTTRTHSVVGTTNATLGGNITDAGGTSTIDIKGIEYKKSTAAAADQYTRRNITHSENSPTSGLGSFYENITLLDPNSNYLYRAWAKNTHGAEVIVIDNPVFNFYTLADVNGSTIQDGHTAAAAILGGTLAPNGETTYIKALGVQYSTDPYFNLEVRQAELPMPGDTYEFGAFTVTTEALLKNDDYYYRAYVTNEAGTTTAADYLPETHKFLTPTDPTLGQVVVTDVTGHAATLNGLLNTTGRENPNLGFVYSPTSLHGTPVLGEPNTKEGIYESKNTYPAATRFEVDISGLSHNTTYSVRAYAQNSATNKSFGSQATGAAYSTTVTTFTTWDVPGIPSTPPHPVVNKTTAVFEATNPSDDGGSPITSRGFVYSGTESHLVIPVNGEISLGNIVTSETARATSIFTAIQSASLTPGTFHWVRSWVRNDQGISYSATRKFYAGVTLGTVTWDIINISGHHTSASGSTKCAEKGLRVPSNGELHAAIGSGVTHDPTNKTNVLGGVLHLPYTPGYYDYHLGRLLYKGSATVYVTTSIPHGNNKYYNWATAGSFVHDMLFRQGVTRGSVRCVF